MPPSTRPSHILCIYIFLQASTAFCTAGNTTSRNECWLSTLQGFGYAVSLAGFFMYNYLKMKQLDQPQVDSRKVQYTALPQLDAEQPSSKIPV